MDRARDETRDEEDSPNHNWLVKKREGKYKNNKQEKRTESVRESKIPPLRLIRPPFPTKKIFEETKLYDCKRNLDRAMDEYNNAVKKEVVVKHHLPIESLPERKKYCSMPKTEDGEEKVTPPLKISLRVDPRVIRSLQNPSVGTNTTITITEEEEKIIDIVRGSGLTFEAFVKFANDTNDDNNNRNVTPNSEENKSERDDVNEDYLERMRDSLVQLRNKNKKEILLFLYYMSLDNHDCANSLLCLSDKNEEASVPCVGSRSKCIFKALKDTVTPESLAKMRKVLRDHMFGLAKGNAETVEGKKLKANWTQTDEYEDICPILKKAKCTQTPDPRTQIIATNKIVSRVHQSTASTAPSSRPPASNVLVNNPALNTANNADGRYRQPGVVGIRDTQMNVLPQFCVQQPGVYAAPNPGIPQALDYRWDPQNRQVVSYPNAHWHTSQFRK